MAGRGRDATIPAWMQKQQHSNGNERSEPDKGVKGQYDDADERHYRRHSSRRSRSDSRDRKRRSSYRRSRSRSRDRSRRRHDYHGGDRYRRDSGRDRQRPPVVPTRLPRRQRKPSNFDVYPPGVNEENAAAYATQAILQHNMQALQGAVGPASFGGAPPPAALGAMGIDAATHPQHTRHARRIYVGGLEDRTAEAEVKEFFNDVVEKATKKKEKGGHVISVYINKDRHFAFVELATMELATACMELDGIKFNGIPLKIRRPNDFNPSLVPKSTQPLDFDLSALGIISTTVPEGPGKIFIGGIPYHLMEEQVKELLQAFGKLKAFHLVRDPGADLSKGYGFCEYMDHSVTDTAIEGLNNLQVGDKQLSVRRALPGVDGEETIDPAEAALKAMNLPDVGPTPIQHPATRVLVLKNMVTSEELQDDEEYDDIVDDIKHECIKFGTVISITVPRPGGECEAAVGKVFVEFEDVRGAEKAAQELHGRGFASRTVEADYIPEKKYASKQLG